MATSDPNPGSSPLLPTVIPEMLYQNATAIYDNTTSLITNFTTEDQNPRESLRDYMTFKVADIINEYYLYIVCALGIPGNLACILTLTFMRPLMSSSIYMLGLAIVDALAIALKFVYVQITANDIQMGDQACQFTFLLGTITQQYSNWILVTMTIERFIAIWFPLKVGSVCTKRNACLGLLFLLVFLSLSNLQFVFTFEEATDPLLVYDCRPKEEYVFFILKIWYWIDGLMYGILPVTFIFVFNGLIIYAIQRQSRRQRDLTSRMMNMNEKVSQQRQVTMMLITISVAFVILILPNCIFFIVREYWHWRENMETIALYYLIYQIVFVLSDLSHALNFYLYCFSGRKFRQKFMQIICFKRRHPQRNPRSYYSSLASMTTSNDRLTSRSINGLSSVSNSTHALATEGGSKQCDVNGDSNQHM